MRLSLKRIGLVVDEGVCINLNLYDKSKEKLLSNSVNHDYQGKYI